jgi:hypothetical protein
MKSSLEFREWESVVRFANALLSQEVDDLQLTVTTKLNGQGACYVVSATGDYDIISLLRGYEKQPTTSTTPHLLNPNYLDDKLCWSGPTYSHAPHEWTEDKPGGISFWCPGASTDRT